MQELVCINQQPLQIKEFQGQRVVTFKDIDGVHKRVPGTARKRFNDNRQRFIEGVDYFVRKTDEAKREFAVTAPNGLILVTQSGYFMLAKSLNDDLAWEVQRQLVDYFTRGKKQCQQIQHPKQLAEYNYHAKYYNGTPVVSVLDITHFTGVTRHALHYHLKHNKAFVLNRDYYFLTGPELAKFKACNAGIPPETNKLYAVTQSGYKKLAKIFGKASNAVEFKQLEPPKPELKESDFNLLKNKNAYDAIMNIANHAEMIFTLLKLIKDYKCKYETCSSLAETLRIITFRCGLESSDLTDLFNMNKLEKTS